MLVFLLPQKTAQHSADKNQPQKKNPVKIVQSKTLEVTVKTESDIYRDVSKYCCARNVYM